MRTRTIGHVGFAKEPPPGQAARWADVKQWGDSFPSNAPGGWLVARTGIIPPRVLFFAAAGADAVAIPFAVAAWGYLGGYAVIAAFVIVGVLMGVWDDLLWVHWCDVPDMRWQWSPGRYVGQRRAARQTQPIEEREGVAA